LAAEGAIRKALEEYGRGVAVLKAIASRLSEEHRPRYLNAPHITRFKAEALELRKALQTPSPPREPRGNTQNSRRKRQA